MESAPPSYPAASVPGYSETPRPNERSVVAGASQSTSQPTEEYQYRNGNLILNLGPKRPRLFRPAYGWNDLVDGFVQLKKSVKNVRSIVASIQGQVTTRLSERGLLSDQKQTIVLQASQTVFDSSEAQVPDCAARYAFSFALPSYVAGGADSLPPSFSALHMGIAVEVTYFIKVEMIRKGKLRQNERIQTIFYYLPRTFAPLPRCELSSIRDEKPNFDDEPDDWQSFEVLPILTRCPVSINMSDLRVALALQQPLVYASGSTIPFTLTITSAAVTEAISSLLSTLYVQLIRITSMQLGSRRAEFETLLGGGIVFRVEEQENERYMFGSVTCSHLGESSWRMDSIDVKYVMRVKVSSSRKAIPSLACRLPTYLRDVPLKMKTHHTTLEGNTGATTPALCRYPRTGGVTLTRSHYM